MAQEPRQVYRTLALARRECSASTPQGFVKYFGGDLETDPGRVKALSGSDNFEFIECFSPEQVDSFISNHNKRVQSIKAAALKLGYMLVQDGKLITKENRL